MTYTYLSRRLYSVFGFYDQRHVDRMVVTGHLPDESKPDQIAGDRFRDDDRHVRLGQHHQPHPMRLLIGVARPEAHDLHHRSNEHSRLAHDAHVAIPVGRVVRGQAARWTG